MALIHHGLGEVRSLREELLRFSADSHSITSLLQLVGLILLIFHHFRRLHPLGPLEVILKTGVFVENFLVTIYHQGRLRLVTLKARGSVFLLHLFELVVEFLDHGGILSPGTGKLLWARRTINDLLSNKIVRWGSPGGQSFLPFRHFVLVFLEGDTVRIHLREEFLVAVVGLPRRYILLSLIVPLLLTFQVSNRSQLVHHPLQVFPPNLGLQEIPPLHRQRIIM